MDASFLARARWRLRGASMWPAFVILTIVDAVLIRLLPPLGDSSSLVGGWLIGAAASLVAVVVLVPPGVVLLRRLRTDVPRVVARDQVGVVVTAGITAVLLAAGLVHHRVIVQDRIALEDATARAEAYIGEHAPARFRVLIVAAQPVPLDTYELEPPRIYRVCLEAASSADPAPANDSYCVIVDRSKAFGQSVRYAGSEPNSTLSQGTS